MQLMRILPKTTALKLNEFEWRAATLESQAARSDLASKGFHWQRLLGDGSSLYLRHGEYCEVELNDVAAAGVYQALIYAEQASARPIAKAKFMAIVNLTADSFSDGGTYQASDAHLLKHCQQLVDDGASILDLGAESTRPGAEEVSARAQIDLLSNAMRILSPINIPLSIDTRSAIVADYCLAAGAVMINDVSAFGDPGMAAAVARHDAQVVLMHSRGTSKTMQQHCDYDYLIGEICDELAKRINHGLSEGVSPERIIIDPGIGFAKEARHNFEIIHGLKAFRSLGFPVLAGPSRKSFLASVLPERAAAQRDGATAGAASICAYHGAEYLRLHCGGMNWDAVKIAQACS
jgi:dihydropteroate synthase